MRSRMKHGCPKVIFVWRQGIVAIAFAADPAPTSRHGRPQGATIDHGPRIWARVNGMTNHKFNESTTSPRFSGVRTLRGGQWGLTTNQALKPRPVRVGNLHCSLSRKLLSQWSKRIVEKLETSPILPGPRIGPSGKRHDEA
jgi:hypothetical protein